MRTIAWEPASDAEVELEMLATLMACWRSLAEYHSPPQLTARGAVDPSADRRPPAPVGLAALESGLGGQRT